MGNFEELAKQANFLSEEIKRKEEKNRHRIIDYKSLKESLESWRFKNYFKMIEKEMGDYIAKGNPDEISSLQKEADRIHAQITALDNDLNTIRGLYLKLKEKPDRHKCLEVTRVTEAFLNASELVTLRDLDSFRCNNLRNIKKQIDDVLRSFEIEAEKVQQNKNTASQLLDQIKRYDYYEDLFNLKQHLNDSEILATRVIRSPNYDNPNDDELKLQTAKSNLDQCIKKVEMEIAEQERIKREKEEQERLERERLEAERRRREEQERLAREKKQKIIRKLFPYGCIFAAACILISPEVGVIIAIVLLILYFSYKN